MSLDLLLARLPARKTLSQKYSLIRWIVYTFLGGAINTLALLLLADFYNKTTFRLSNLAAANPATGVAIWTGWLQITFSILLVVLVPIILSLLFSRFSPELQIVSPLNMQIISLAWILVYLYTNNYFVFGNILFLGAYTILVGLFQDNVAIELVGRVANKDDIITTSIRVETDLPYLLSILQIKTFRETLKLKKKVEQTKETAILRSQSDSQYQTTIMLTKGEQEKETFLDMAVFEKDKYALKLTNELKEFAEFERFYYLNTILRRTKLKHRKLSKDHAEKLCELIADDLKGKAFRMQNVPAISWIKLIGVVASITLCVLGYYENWLRLDEMLAILIPTIVYAIFEFPLKRGEERQEA